MPAAGGSGGQGRGRAAEEYAAGHLCAAGLQLLARNYRCRQGEIDLVMRDGDVLVFVEVRYRRIARYGSAAMSVDARKQARLIHCAEHYLAREADGRAAARFDVVALAPAADGGMAVEWIRNAFDAG